MRYLKIISLHTLAFVFMILLYSGRVMGISPTAICGFAVFTFLGGNYFILSAMQLAIGLITDFGWLSFFRCLAIAAAFGAVKLYSIFAKKKASLLLLGVTSIMASIPFVLIGADFSSPLTLLVAIVCNELTSFAGLIAASGCRYKNGGIRLTVAEKTACGIMLFALGIAVSGLSVGVSLFWIPTAFSLLLLPFLFASAALLPLFLFCLGAVLTTGDVTLPIVAECLAILVISLKRLPTYIVALICTAAYSGFVVLSGLNPFLIIPFAVGALLYLLFSRKSKERLRLLFVGGNGRIASRSIVNRTRQELFSRLSAVSASLLDVSFALKSEEIKRPLKDYKTELSDELARKYCHGCTGYDGCSSIVNADTSSLLYQMVAAVVDNGTLSSNDIPQALSTCPKMDAILRECRTIPLLYEQSIEVASVLEGTKCQMSEQMEGLAAVLKSLSDNVLRVVSFDEKLEALLTEGLSYEGILVSEVVIYKDNSKRMYCSLVVRAEDEEKNIVSAVSRLLGSNMTLAEGALRQGETVTLFLMTAPKYDVQLGEAWHSKRGTVKCGDSRTLTRLSPDKFLVAICDGMGSGEGAENASRLTIELVESFFRAGVSNDAALKLVNKLLLMRKNESFSAIDIAVVDLNSGEASYIKMGGVESFVVSKNGIEVIPSGALPLGVFEEIRPTIARGTLTAGDCLVLVSDGVTDALGSDGVVGILENTGERMPEPLANYIVREAVRKNSKDDASAVCVRVVPRL